MENIRQRLAQDPQLYPSLGGIQKPKGGATPVISIASSSSSTSSTTQAGKYRSNRAIVISSDEEDDDVPARKAVLKPSPANEAIRMPVPAPFKSTPVPIELPANNVRMPVPTHFPAHKDLQKPRPNPPTNRYDPPGEEVFVPDFADDNQYTSPEDAEKALRDLMGGAMNEETDAPFTEEDRIVKGFKDHMRLLDHQVLGRRWMKEREDPALKKNGGILADDMGLGKTVQTLTRISEGRPKTKDREDGWAAGTLVICPLALVGQWADEIANMTTGLIVIKHQGTSRTADPLVLRRAHVVVTTYDTAKSEFGVFSPPAKDESKKGKSTKTPAGSDDDSDSDAGHLIRKKVTKSKAKPKDALFRIKWWRVVLDEAHNIKNRATLAAKACCELEAKFRWCLTGTPMQNDVTELYSLLKFLRIKPFNDWERFNTQIAKPVKSGRGANRAMKRLQVVLKQVMLRRRKDQMLNGKVLIELPLRTVKVMSCTFDRSEQAFYDALESKMESVIEKLISSEKANYISVLLLLLRLRQACNHPSLVAKDYKTDLEAVDTRPTKKGPDEKDTDDADDLAMAFEQLGVTRKCEVCTAILTSDNVSEDNSKHCVDCAPLAIQAKQQESDRPMSAKIRAILKLLADIDERSEGEEKTIIFSQFTSMLDLIEPFLKENGIRFVRYDGSMKPIEREASLSKIKETGKIRVILISFKAGSTGLNLTACNNVILVDLWWNPALEDQAFDRAHRMGQTKDVNIWKLKIDGTVEDRILELQEKKRELARAALSGDKIKNMRLGMDDLLALFKPGARDDDDEDD